MIAPTGRPGPNEPEPGTGVVSAQTRLFLLEPGWKVTQKVGSEREFCHMTAPGQDYYHPLRDGEIYLYRSDEKLCLPCAERRGLLERAPRPLGQRPLGTVVEPPSEEEGPAME